MNLSLKKNSFQTLVIASTNEGKVQEFKKLLSNYPLLVLGQPDGLKVEETGKRFIDNARLNEVKASFDLPSFCNELPLFKCAWA